MAEFPYATVPGKISKMFSRIQSVGTPATPVTKQFLSAIGFTDTNDATLLRILQFLGFIDTESKPTNRWREYRDKSKASKVLGIAVVESYADLFRVYADGNKRDREELANFFRSTTSKGTKAVGLMVTTFKNLCEIADFTEAQTPPEIPVASPDLSVPQHPVEMNGSTVTEVLRVPLGAEVGAGLTINLNVQLTVPETTDRQVYEDFFAAMKKHLLS